MTKEKTQGLTIDFTNMCVFLESLLRFKSLMELFAQGHKCKGRKLSSTLFESQADLQVKLTKTLTSGKQTHFIDCSPVHERNHKRMKTPSSDRSKKALYLLDK